MKFVGDKQKVQNVTISQILPETTDYMTYDGSQTEPGCSETVSWIIMNRPIYITHKQVSLDLSFKDLSKKWNISDFHTYIAGDSLGR